MNKQRNTRKATSRRQTRKGGANARGLTTRKGGANARGLTTRKGGANARGLTTRKGGACPCNMRAGSRKRKQTGGTTAGVSAFWNRPWLSTVPENMLQHSGIRWSGQPAPVSLYPTVHDYKLLSDYNPIVHNYGRGTLSTI